MKIFEMYVRFGEGETLIGKSRNKQHLESIIERLRADYPEWRDYTVEIR